MSAISPHRTFLSTTNIPNVPNTLTLADFQVIEEVFKELEDVCRYSIERKVRVMIDAEQTYFQPAIDNIVLLLCSLLNPKIKSRYDTKTEEFSEGGGYPVVFTTYQMYLKVSMFLFCGFILFFRTLLKD